MNKKQEKRARFSITYFLVAFLLILLFQELIFQPMILDRQEVSYSQFREDIADNLVTDVTFTEERIFYSVDVEQWSDLRVEDTAAADLEAQRDLLDTLLDQQEELVFNTIAVEDPDLVQDLLAADVNFSARAPSTGFFTSLLGWVLPFLPLALIWFFMFRRMGQGNQMAMSIGKSNAREIAGEITGIKFEDVGGVDEVEVELKEIIEFLKNPDEYTRIGAKLPKGVLMVGPPGTGKTLLAKATAGEAGVPFFSISGSEFVEMFVGVGAARVRDMFDQAKKRAPCIVFIDEIDAIGQSRNSVRSIGGHSEQEQTLNQLLTEMDGFAANQGVVIMAATNRPEILDPALLRPGRFDRQVQVTLPTEAGRREILHIHTKSVNLDKDVDLTRISKITPGFSGADLANIVNEAALIAVRNNRLGVTMSDFDLAIERVVAGLQRKITLKGEVKRKVAYHEGGHALVAQLLTRTDPVHKVSIIPTAKGALGYTMQMPEEDQYLIGQTEMEQRMAVMLGGRVAEQIIFGEPSTGASNDLQRVTDMARRMVTEFGMTEALGPVRYASPNGSYLDMRSELRPELSPETTTRIDHEIRRLVEEAECLADELLRDNIAALHAIADVLQEKEVISGEDVARLAGENAPRPEVVPAN